MSNQAINWVYDNSPSTGTARAVLLYLANCANEGNQWCWPSVQIIAAKCKISRSAVFAAIKKLEASAEIQIQHSPGMTPNRYLVLIEMSENTTSTEPPVQNLDGAESGLQQSRIWTPTVQNLDSHYR